MSDHTRALVPLESWAYASPELRIDGRRVDLGLLAEALIYYEVAIINVTNPEQFAELLSTLASEGALNDFLALCEAGEILVYEYSFITTAVLSEGVYSLFNIQDPLQAQPNTFQQRYLYQPSVEAVFSKARHRKRLYRALRDRVIEVKADQFGAAIENARADFEDPDRNAIVVQAVVDELYALKKLGPPPYVEARIDERPDGRGKTITWNVNFDQLASIGGPNVNFHNATPLTASAISNRFVWSSAGLNCDLFLPRPMSVLVGDKLYESSKHVVRPEGIVFDLEQRVEFPDVRRLINTGQLTFGDALAIRKKARRFRKWLQDEADRDRDAIVAYHNEVAKESGLTNTGRKALAILAATGGGAAGGVLGAVLKGPEGAAIGGAIGGGTTYLIDIASKLASDWRPVVFGNWLKGRIEKLMQDRWLRR
jgi:hypothetical protein